MLHTHKFKQAIQEGFTIVELMIATLVFSIILLVITVGVIHFTNAYYKGVNSSTTQNTARSVIDAVSQAIEFGGGYFSSGPTTYCIGNLQFDYVLGSELESAPAGTQTKNALYQSPGNGSSCSALAGNLKTGVNVPNGKELLGANMRISKFVITQLPNKQFSIDVRVAYGDDGLLRNPASTTAACLDQSGSQFCAVSELTTIVQSRV